MKSSHTICRRSLCKIVAIAVAVFPLAGCSNMEPATDLLDLSLLEDGQPHYTHRVPYEPWWRQTQELEHLPESGEMGFDLRSYDVSAFDLSAMSGELQDVAFDSHTKWPENLPDDFDPEAIMELGKDPGLGIRELHRQGITGEGVNIAIIDQALVQDHTEYADRLMTYEQIHCYDDSAQMHGPAVTSIAAGKTCGVAPEANIYYIASTFADVGSNRFQENLLPMAESIERILEINEVLPKNERIKVISISKGITGAKGAKETFAAIEKAKSSGIFVITTSTESTYGFSLMGLGREFLNDPNDPSSYSPGVFWADSFYSDSGRYGEDMLLVPMDARTYAGWGDTTGYEFGASGGLSWSVPWLAGMYALCLQIDPDLTYDQFIDISLETGNTIEVSRGERAYSLGKIINPKAIVARVAKIGEPEAEGMSSDFSGLEDRYLRSLFLSGALHESWDSPEAIDPDCLVIFATYENLRESPTWFDNPPEITPEKDMLVPAEEVEAHILSHFDLLPDRVRQSQAYLPEKNAYSIGGVGGASNCEVAAAEQTDGRLHLSYNAYQDGMRVGSGTLVISEENEGAFQYLSNAFLAVESASREPVDDLIRSVEYTPADNALRFTIPEAVPDGYQLYLHIGGSLAMGDGQMSYHAFEQESEACSWILGQTYTQEIPADSVIELVVTAGLKREGAADILCEIELLLDADGERFFH